MEENYIESCRKQFLYYKMLGERTFEQLEEDGLFWQYNETSNNIAVIVQHLAGNMKSRWTDFLTTDGEKGFRDREQEFMPILNSRITLLQQWNEGWQCLFDALDAIPVDNFNTLVYIRNMGHTIVEAINRQLTHYAYHVGQIVFIGRMIKGSEWQSLSIPKGNSAEYNDAKFAVPKHKEHFTATFLSKK